MVSNPPQRAIRAKDRENISLKMTKKLGKTPENVAKTMDLEAMKKYRDRIAVELDELGEKTLPKTLKMEEKDGKT